jgi:hypothetical protein
VGCHRAAAALVQAIGVVGGVIYAALELKTIREEATANRSNNLLDELSRLLLQMTRMSQIAQNSFRGCCLFRDAARDAEKDGRLEARFKTRLVELFVREANTHRDAKLQLETLVQEVDRANRSLTKNPSHFLLQLRIRVGLLPSQPSNFLAAEPAQFPSRDFHALEEAIQKISSQVFGLLAQAAPLERLR